MPFHTERDTATELATAIECGTAWNCRLVPLPPLSPIDWYAVRGDAVIAWVEAKARSHSTDAYPTVWLSARKYWSLTMASVSFGIPAIYVVRFTDGIRFIDVAKVDAAQFHLGKRRDMRARMDAEPVILIPIPEMQSLKGNHG